MIVFYIGSMRACPVNSLTILGDPGVDILSKYSIIHCFTLTCEIEIVWRVSGNTSAS